LVCSYSLCGALPYVASRQSDTTLLGDQPRCSPLVVAHDHGGIDTAALLDLGQQPRLPLRIHSSAAIMVRVQNSDVGFTAGGAGGHSPVPLLPGVFLAHTACAPVHRDDLAHGSPCSSGGSHPEVGGAPTSRPAGAGRHQRDPCCHLGRPPAPAPMATVGAKTPTVRLAQWGHTATAIRVAPSPLEPPAAVACHHRP